MDVREGEGGMWERQWFTSLGAVIEHQCVHLSCSWEEFPPLPPFLPPCLPSCFASSHPGKGQQFWSARLSSQKGTGEKKSGQPHLSHFTCELCSRKEHATSVSKLRTVSWWRSNMTTSQPWNSRNVYEMEGALMGWPHNMLLKLSPNQTRWWGFVSSRCSGECTRRHKVSAYNYCGSLWMNEIIHWGWW